MTTKKKKKEKGTIEKEKKEENKTRKKREKMLFRIHSCPQHLPFALSGVVWVHLLLLIFLTVL